MATTQNLLDGAPRAAHLFFARLLEKLAQSEWTSRPASLRAIAPVVALIAALLIAGAAQAQGGNTSTFSNSQTESLVFNPATVTTTNVTIYSTQILGRLNGGVPLYDQTFGVAYSDLAAQAGVAAARAAITTAGGPGVIIGAPVMTASSSNTTSTSTTTYSLAGSQQTANTLVTFGPNNIAIGQLSRCDVSGLPGDTRPTCQALPGTPYGVVDGETNYNTVTNTEHTIDQSTVTTNTTALFEQWTLFGTVQAVGVVHTAVQSAAFDATSRFLRRLGDETSQRQQAGGGAPLGYASNATASFPLMAYGENGATSNGPGIVDPARFGGWAEVYGGVARNDADGAVPGDRRQNFGFAGGMSFALNDAVTLGFGIDHGRTSIDLDSAFAESGDIDLTEFGLNAGFSSGRWFANLAATFGVGDADTTHALGAASTASYDITTWGLLAETGYRFNLGEVRLTPSIGLDHINVRTGNFVESGGMALAAPAHSADRTRAWLGLDLGRRWPVASGGSFDLSGYGRLVGVLSGEERLLPVAFAAGGPPMSITGASEGRLGADLGVKASYGFGNGASLFAAYDARLRDGFDAHQGRIGFRLTW